MGQLSNFEHEHVLGDLRVFREYDTSSFNTNAKLVLNKGTDPFTLPNDIAHYANILEKAIVAFGEVKINKDEVKACIEQINDKAAVIDRANLVVNDLDDVSVGTFRMQYLENYLKMAKDAVEEVLTADPTDYRFSPFASNEIPFKVEKQIVKLNDGYGLSPKSLAKNYKAKLVKVDIPYIKTKILPYVSNYDTLRASTLLEANDVLKEIKDAETNMRQLVAAVQKYLSEHKEFTRDRIALVNNVLYNVMRNTIEIISFVTFVMIRKLNQISSNIISCGQFYIDLQNTLSIAATESAFDNCIMPLDIESLKDEIIKGQSNGLSHVAEKIYQYHANIPSLSNTSVNLDSIDENKDYNAELYNSLGKIFLEVSAGLDIIARDSIDYLMIFDDLIEKSGFILRLEDRFRPELTAITDTTIYDGMENRAHADGFDAESVGKLLGEVKAFPDRMQKICNIVLDTFTKLQSLSKRFSENINGEFKDAETVNEIKLFLKDLDEQYKTVVYEMAKGFLLRLKKMDNILNAVENDTAPIDSTTEVIDVTDDMDYNESAFESIAEEYDLESKILFATLEHEYFSEKSKALRGTKVIFEAETPTTNTGSNNANTANNNQNATQNQPAEQKSNTSVSIQDNSGEGNGKANSVASKISAWIQETINKFMEFIGKQSKKNLQWLNANKEALASRSYNNVTVNILPYRNMPAETIQNDIKKLESNVKTLTVQVLNGLQDKNALYKKMFSFISGGIKDGEPSLKDQFTKYYKVGKGNLEVMPISNSDLKSEITNTMIPYCENYYGGFSDNIKTALEALGTTVDSMQETYMSGNVGDKSKWVSEAVKYFSGSILNAIRDRNNDYFKVLSSLAPKTPVKPDNDSADNSNPQNNTEQQQNA